MKVIYMVGKALPKGWEDYGWSKTFSLNPRQPMQRTFGNKSKRVQIIDFPESRITEVTKYKVAHSSASARTHKKVFPNSYKGSRRALNYARSLMR
jgi:hypothetical protein